jgi:hypothetical protein
MMVSYLATLDGGVRFEDQITVHQKDSSGKDREVSTRVGLPSVLSLLNQQELVRRVARVLCLVGQTGHEVAHIWALAEVENEELRNLSEV